MGSHTSMPKYWQVLAILFLVFHAASANFFKDTEIGVLIGIGAGAVVVIILILVLTAYCFRCCCFAKSKPKHRNPPPRDARDIKVMHQRTPEPAWDANQQMQQPQQQFIPSQPIQQSQHRPSSLDSQVHPSLSHTPPQVYSPQLLSDKNLTPQDDTFSQQNYPQSPPPSTYPSQDLESPNQQNYSTSPQIPSGNYPPTFPTQSQMHTGNSRPPSHLETHPNVGQQHYFPQDQEYPADFYQDQYPDVPMTSRVLSGFRYPEGLIDELGHKKLKPPPPPKPIKLISQVQNDVPLPDY